MRKVVFIMVAFTILVFAQEISMYGNHGMFKLKYAEPHNMGMFSFHLGAEERYEAIETTQWGQNVTDRKHYFKLSTGLSYSIIDYIETRFNAMPFMKWFEMDNFPQDRGDPDPVIGFEALEVGVKLGYPIVLEKETPLSYAFGVDGYVDFGPALSTQYFNNALDCDKRFYSDSFPESYGVGGSPYAPHFPAYVPHDPDVGATGLADFRIGPFAAHLNGGYLKTGIDQRPAYVDSLDFQQRPDYFVHGAGIQLIPSENVRILFEVMGFMEMDENNESLWVTPGFRFGSSSVSFDLGCELGIMNPETSPNDTWWKVFFNFSGGTDLIKKVEIHYPLAKVTGRVYDAKTGEPVMATITFPGADKEAVQTAATGTYDVSLPPGSFRVHAEAEGYRWQEKGVVLKDGDQIIIDFTLNKKEISKVLGKVYDIETKAPIVATITFPQTQFPAVNSDTSGMYGATLAPGTFRLHVEATGYQFDEKVVTLVEGDSKVVDIGLMKVSLAQATLMGKVSEVETGTPLLAQITFVDSKIPATTTDPTTGIYKVSMTPGTFVVKIDADGYITETAPIVLAKDETKIQNFTLRKVPKVGEKIILRGIYFDFNSAVIKPESYPVLDDAAKVLIALPKMRIEIGGHTDSIGSDSYNMTLSYNRANAVRDYLIRYHNIDAARLEVRGYGETQPIADNRTKSGRDQNRRIEFKILSVD